MASALQRRSRRVLPVLDDEAFNDVVWDVQPDAPQLPLQARAMIGCEAPRTIMIPTDQPRRF
jgi:hypothetical protein